VGTANSQGLASVTIYFEVLGSAPDVAGWPDRCAVRNGRRGWDLQRRAIVQTRFAGLQCRGRRTLRHASPGSGGWALDSGSWSASVDPEVEIDPSFAYASDFTLEFSAGPSGATVPEPSGTLLLCIGLVACPGAAKYKRPAK
jgi:hypothetical protein